MRPREFGAVRHCCPLGERRYVLERTPTPPRALPRSPGSPWFPQGSPLCECACVRPLPAHWLVPAGGGNTTSGRGGNGFTATSAGIEVANIMRSGLAFCEMDVGSKPFRGSSGENLDIVTLNRPSCKTVLHTIYNRLSTRHAPQYLWFQ